MRLEELRKDAVIKGILPDRTVTVVDVRWFGDSVVELTYKDNAGRLANELVYRDREPLMEEAEAGRPWSFNGDGELLRMVSEAWRIKLAHLFDPHLAVHTSNVEPLPHQITAVYGEMLSRQPLRFLLADDPGAGKTIMTGLLIKELIARGDLARCLIVCPGNLAEQWQDELDRRFHLPFEILTNDRLEAARTGNAFTEIPLLIARLDKLSRSEDVQAKLQASEWDLVVCDEAHKMSASFFGGEVKYTKRYHLGQLLSRITRHFLLLTATPHNGKEEDFQLFMALLDGDRFEGRFRDGVHTADTSDLMRRLVKEDLLKFDGTPLFPERKAYSVNYTLSNMEARLYEEVTRYVREEFNRAERIGNENRRGTVGFALTSLQRRLASSPEAIYQSLKHRKERLQKRLQEEELLKRGAIIANGAPVLSADDLEDLEDAPDQEIEDAEDAVIDQATAALTIAELRVEIELLGRLEILAREVRASGTDRKWEQLSSLLQNNSTMFDATGLRRKLVLFTEHRDTLNYLVGRIRSLLGRDEAVVSIQGGMGREERKRIQESFTQGKDTLVLVATDAAGEGINLQRAHLMVNYDLPWNPNRLEQRFGRIHRIGQTEVCHLWNLVAYETREGEVFQRLFEKLEEERAALGGRVFDVLGKVMFDNRPLRELLVEAIRYGDLPEVRDRLNQVVNQALDRESLRQLLEERALVHDTMDVRRVMEIREDMERIEARRLQPHFIAAFFRGAFALLGGKMHEREPKRWEITHVPAAIRSRDRLIGTGIPVLATYERICFEKERVSVPGKPLAAFICPGHPLLDSVLDMILERHRELLKRGAILIDPVDVSDEPRVLAYIEHAICDARTDRSGNRRVISKQLQFVEMNGTGVKNAGPAPYLDYRAATPEEIILVQPTLATMLQGLDVERKVMDYAVQHLVPRHFDAVRADKERRVDKTTAAVKERLTKEIGYWDHRALELAAQESTGRINAALNSAKARQRADDLTSRLHKRLEELAEERRLAPLPPVVFGGALVVPQGLLDKLHGVEDAVPTFARDTRASELAGMRAVMEYERNSGFEPVDVSAANCGYDIECRIPGTGRLRFIEVKGRVAGATTVIVTKNEILTALNKPEDFILAIVEIAEGTEPMLHYIRRPFRTEPDFGVTSVIYNIADLLSSGDVDVIDRNI